jgi:hypothetical protein
MRKQMSLTGRQELMKSVAPRYQLSTWRQKSAILDEFVAATGYARKHAICILGRTESTDRCGCGCRKRRYDGPVADALVILWRAANGICAKRLVPFLPELLDVMLRLGHLSLTCDVQERLLSMSISTADRLLAPERRRDGRGISTTRPGQLLKRQITVRTFSEWNDVEPGFFEIDIVAHLGEWPGGAFLNTLVLTDVATGWTEFCALPNRSEVSVTDAISQVRSRLPFNIRGLDTDNGSEFINYEMLGYCDREGITFTRGRANKKNDQCFVEEKNGSIVRRLIGYSRYEGSVAWQVLTQIYDVLREYVNFFQPSLKLLSKQRDGSHLSKKYDAARTPYQRLIASGVIVSEVAELAQSRYRQLDPVLLLSQMARLQQQLWPLACPVGHPASIVVCSRNASNPSLRIAPVKPNTIAIPSPVFAPESIRVAAKEGVVVQDITLAAVHKAEPATPTRAYRRVKAGAVPHTWRTREDPFAAVCERLRLLIIMDPSRTAKDLLQELRGEQPDGFNGGHLRTLQRRVGIWRRELLGSDPSAEVSIHVHTERSALTDPSAGQGCAGASLWI